MSCSGSCLHQKGPAHTMQRVETTLYVINVLRSLLDFHPAAVLPARQHFAESSFHRESAGSRCLHCVHMQQGLPDSRLMCAHLDVKRGVLPRCVAHWGSLAASSAWLAEAESLYALSGLCDACAGDVAPALCVCRLWIVGRRLNIPVDLQRQGMLLVHPLDDPVHTHALALRGVSHAIEDSLALHQPLASYRPVCMMPQHKWYWLVQCILSLLQVSCSTANTAHINAQS